VQCATGKFAGSPGSTECTEVLDYCGVLVCMCKLLLAFACVRHVHALRYIYSRASSHDFFGNISMVLNGLVCLTDFML
jgi:hypothetical protein